MFIQTEQTPNPATLKFIPGEVVVETGTYEFETPEDAEISPLAKRLFDLGDVTGVFLGQDFVSVSKGEGADWATLKPSVLGIIMEHFTAGDPVVLDNGKADAAGHSEAEADGEDAEIVAQIKELLDTRVRPAVAMDGGDIVFHGFEKGVVYLRMRGACAGCPSSTMTLKAGIENLLRHYVPEVVEVRAVN